MRKYLFVLLILFVSGCDKSKNEVSSNETKALFHEDTTQILENTNNPIPKKLYTLPSISN